MLMFRHRVHWWINRTLVSVDYGPSIEQSPISASGHLRSANLFGLLPSAGLTPTVR